MNRPGHRVALSASCLLLIGLTGLPLHPAAAAEDPRGYVVVLKDSVTDPGAVANKQTRSRGGSGATAVYRHALKGYAAIMTSAQATALGKDPQVRFVSEQRTYRTSPPRRQPASSSSCDGASFTPQCRPVFLDRVNAEASSTHSGDGKGSVDVNVAVLDGGIAGDVPDLNVRGGADCLTGSPVTPGTSLLDEDGHGTMVAGIIGARDDDQGLVGVAPGTPLWAVKVAVPDGTISDAALLCGIDWVTSTRTDADPSNDIAVYNMSLASDHTAPVDADDHHCGTVNHDPFHLAVCNAVTAGVTPVAAAGNENLDLARVFPASYDEVITATAMADFDGKPHGKVPPVCYGRDNGFFGDSDDEAALSFSNFARSAADRKHTLAAPGVCMESTIPLPNHHAVGDGTSFASPVVAGVLALCIDAGRCGDSTPARNLRTLLQDARRYNTADPGYGFFGDPHRPIPGRYYGDLIAADRY
ncbi:S8 family serine peptidase [Streptomyces sp. NPDC058401]|uniref:S8 family peptidase n=1 Tax=Streptomyces sp. NPDC058401 TaxID=3346480 RepID=UPI00366110F0